MLKEVGLHVCTQDNFTIRDPVYILKSVLEGKYGLQCTIHNKNPEKGSYRIYISGRSLPTLCNLVAEYMHPSMMYKINK